MKKQIKIFVLMIIVVVVAVSCVGCGASKPTKSIHIDNTFDIAEFESKFAMQKVDNVNFATNGKSDYVIVYPDVLDAIKLPLKDEKMSKECSDSIALKNAVDFLVQSLSTIVGQKFEAKKQSEFLSGDALIVKLDDTLTQVKNSGYALSIEQGKIVVSAKDFAGLKNGIYTFLEKYLGCMFVTKDYDYLPQLATINFEKTFEVDNPDVVWREVYAYESEKNGDDAVGVNQWCNKLKLNGAGMQDWGTWCHTFFTYIPPTEFFESHPEYFAEYNGARKYENGPVSGQLCLTNEDVYQIVSQRLFAQMAENPDVKYWDFSQMDTWINRGTGCRCKECKKLDDEQGSPMGSLLTFVNRLASECAIKFPNNFISTLAYNYSVVPPKTLKPLDNVIIKLCFMPGDVTSDIKNPRNKKAEDCKKTIEEWSAISKNLLIWDYNIDFHQYLMPYPIFTALQANNDFYIDNNVYGMFHQMGRDAGGYSAELSAYVFAQIMWDRTVKVEDILSKYMAVCYGKAAAPMAEYYNEIENNVISANRELYIYSTVGANRQDYLSKKNVDKYLALFEEAEKLAADDTAVLSRIKKNKIGVLYVKAQEISLDKKSRLAALEEFKLLCDKYEINSVYEGNSDNENEVQTFYNQQLKIVNNIGWITAGIVIACIIVVGGGVVVGVVVGKKIKNKNVENKN